MSVSRETRLKMLRSNSEFVFAESAQFINGEGVSLIICNAYEAQLTVGKSWLFLSIENARHGQQVGWIFFMDEVIQWAGEASGDTFIDPEEKKAITESIAKAVEVDGLFCIFDPEC